MVTGPHIPYLLSVLAASTTVGKSPVVPTVYTPLSPALAVSLKVSSVFTVSALPLGKDDQALIERTVAPKGRLLPIVTVVLAPVANEPVQLKGGWAILSNSQSIVADVSVFKPEHILVMYS